MVKGQLVDRYGAALQRASVFYDSPSTGSYEINRDKGRRRNPRTGKTQEHITYNQRHRDKAQGTIYDLIRNDIVAQWAFNKFLDYTTVHYFQCSTGDQVLDDEIEYAVDEWMRPENCDISKRHSLNDMIRLHASGKALDGDSALLLVNNYKIQGIEGDNIRTPDYKTDSNRGNISDAVKKSVQGLILDEFGAVQKYVICRKSERPGCYKYVTTVDANNIVFDGNFFRFDQVRGVPVLNAAANTAQDIKEIDEYQLIKVKKHAMFGIAIKSDAALTGFNEAPLSGGFAGNGAATTSAGPAYQFEMDAGLKLEMNPGDSIDMFESKTPSQEYRDFSAVMTRKFLLTWELPYEFFDPGNASYSTMKHIRAEFKFGIQRFEQRNRNTRYRILRWRLQALLNENKIKLPPKFKDNKIFRYLSWLPQAEPWLEEDREVSAALARIDGGLSNHEIEAARRGNDAYDIMRGTARAQQYIRKSKLVVATGMPGATLWNADSMNPAQSTPVNAGSIATSAPSPDNSSAPGVDTSTANPDNNGANNDSAN